MTYVIGDSWVILRGWLGHTPTSYSSQFLRSMKQFVRLTVFILEDALSVWTNLGKHALFVWLCVSSIKTGARRIMRLDELFSIVRFKRRETKDSSSTRIMCLVPVSILETHNQTNNECLPKLVQTDNASSITAALSIVLKFSVPNRETFYRPHEKLLFRLQTCSSLVDQKTYVMAHETNCKFCPNGTVIHVPKKWSNSEAK